MSAWRAAFRAGFLDGLSFGDATSFAQGVEVSVEHTWPWPPWVTLLGLIALVLLVVVLYLRGGERATPRLRFALAAIRTAILALVVFMMYGWMQHRHRTDLADLVVILDDSQSMEVEDHVADLRQRQRIERWLAELGFDSPTRFSLARALLLDQREGWLEALSDRYRLKFYLAGETARGLVEAPDELSAELRRLRPEGAASRLGQAVARVLESQRGRATAAILVLTDGITTEGPALSEIAPLARRRAVPLFLVGLGNEQPPRDVRLSDLTVDESVFVDDVIHFDFKIHSSGYEGRSAAVRLQRADGDAVLDQQQVTLPADGTPQSARLSYRPDQEGTLEHVVELAPLDGEVQRENNRLTRRIQVRDAAIRVLLVQAYPNYEFRFLKNLLGRLVQRDAASKLVELTTVLQEADLEYTQQDATAERVFPVSRETLFSFDVLIFGDVNPEALGRSAMTHVADFVKERGGGVVFLAGPRFTPLAYRGTPLAELLPVELSTAAVPPADSLLDKAFAVRLTLLGAETPHLQVGDSREESAAVWEALPGLRWQLAAPDLRPAARVLIEHAEATDSEGKALPVVCLQFVGAGKVVFHATDETYRWSRYEGEDTYYARYWLQTLRYLSRAKLLSEAQPAEINTDRQEYRQGEAVRVAVRFADDRLAPAADDGVRVVVEDEMGRRRQLTLYRETARRGAFSATVSDLRVGDYRAWLMAPGLQPRPSPRQFTVRPPFGEHMRLEMDAQDLRQAAEASRGRFYTLDSASRLLGELPQGRQVRVESLPPEPIWNSWLLAAAFVALITTEWILRRWAGMI